MNVLGYISDLIGSKDGGGNAVEKENEEEERHTKARRSLSVGGHTVPPGRGQSNLTRKLAKPFGGWSSTARKSRGGEAGSADAAAEDDHPSGPDDVQLQNSLNELQILVGHSDIVRLMHKIDEFKYGPSRTQSDYSF
jgi:hypothetical protein